MELFFLHKDKISHKYHLISMSLAYTYIPLVNVEFVESLFAKSQKKVFIDDYFSNNENSTLF